MTNNWNTFKMDTFPSSFCLHSQFATKRSLCNDKTAQCSPYNFFEFTKFSEAIKGEKNGKKVRWGLANLFTWHTCTYKELHSKTFLSKTHFAHSPDRLSKNVNNKPLILIVTTMILFFKLSWITPWTFLNLIIMKLTHLIITRKTVSGTLFR